MSQIIDTTADQLMMEDTAGIMKRTAVMLYGVISYTVGVAGLLWLMLAMCGLAPSAFSPLQTGSLAAALIVNLGLVVLFSLQHSVMARDGFKRWITRFIPQAMERSTYILLSGIVTAATLYFWQPLPGTVWSVENSLGKIALWSAYAIGWAYLFTATFVTNHFELMGLRQSYLYFMGRPYTSLPFTRKYMYRYSRHPMMLGMLIALWAVVEMSVTHLVISSLMTAYIVLGIFLEERDLLRKFGDTYRKYRMEIATLLPGVY